MNNGYCFISGGNRAYTELRYIELSKNMLIRIVFSSKSYLMRSVYYKPEYISLDHIGKIRHVDSLKEIRETIIKFYKLEKLTCF